MPAISMHTGMHLIQVRHRLGPSCCLALLAQPACIHCRFHQKFQPRTACFCRACLRQGSLLDQSCLPGESHRHNSIISPGRYCPTYRSVAMSSLVKMCLAARSGRGRGGSSCSAMGARPPTSRTTARPSRPTSPPTTAAWTSPSTSWQACSRFFIWAPYPAGYGCAFTDSPE